MPRRRPKGTSDAAAIAALAALPMAAR